MAKPARFDSHTEPLLLAEGLDQARQHRRVQFTLRGERIVRLCSVDPRQCVFDLVDEADWAEGPEDDDWHGIVSDRTTYRLPLVLACDYLGAWPLNVGHTGIPHGQSTKTVGDCDEVHELFRCPRFERILDELAHVCGRLVGIYELGS